MCDQPQFWASAGDASIDCAHAMKIAAIDRIIVRPCTFSLLRLVGAHGHASVSKNDRGRKACGDNRFPCELSHPQEFPDPVVNAEYTSAARVLRIVSRSADAALLIASKSEVRRQVDARFAVQHSRGTRRCRTRCGCCPIDSRLPAFCIASTAGRPAISSTHCPEHTYANANISMIKPLYFITAAAFGAAFGHFLPLHDAARLATCFYMAWALLLVALTARGLYDGRRGWPVVLILIGCLGLFVRGHQMITDLALFAEVATGMYGLARRFLGSNLGTPAPPFGFYATTLLRYAFPALLPFVARTACAPAVRGLGRSRASASLGDAAVAMVAVLRASHDRAASCYLMPALLPLALLASAGLDRAPLRAATAMDRIALSDHRRPGDRTVVDLLRQRALTDLDTCSVPNTSRGCAR